MGSAAMRAKGLTGKGVTVGVVDSGCDATQPDLAKRVKHNVSLISAEYANGSPDSSNTLVVPEDQGPYSNSDIGGGHGTHVAGIVAADSSSVSDKSRYGVAPGANLACFAIGQVLFTTAVVTAYDYMLDQPDLLGIDVVNNSWGNSYRQYDPRDPVAVATKAVADQGVTVVFAAGNSGAEQVSGSLNPFSQSPWVISVAAGTIDRHRGDFSSNGLVYDNSQATAIGAGGHTTYTGDRIGLVHPDITAPGVDISSTCDSLGTVIGPCAPGDNATASGTSMASPHIAGAAAVLKQAQPKLTPTQVRQALQASASKVMVDGGTATAPFWQVGYGYANLDKAVALVRGDGWQTRLANASSAADSRVRAADGQQGAQQRLLDLRRTADRRRRLGHAHLQDERLQRDAEAVRQRRPPVARHRGREPAQLHRHRQGREGQGRGNHDRVRHRRLRHRHGADRPDQEEGRARYVHRHGRRRLRGLGPGHLGQRLGPGPHGCRPRRPAHQGLSTSIRGRRRWQ